jgi:ADP-heptose:LPS heptosyltransferase
MITRLAIGGLRVAALALKRKNMAIEDVSSVALVELTGLGDVISMLPAVQGFRSLFPSANLRLVVDHAFGELLDSFQLPATVHSVEASQSPSGVITAIQLVQRMRPTLVCSMSPPRRNALVALASGAPGIAGYLRYTDSLAPYLLKTPVEVFGLTSVLGIHYGRDHISERALMVCRALGLRQNVPPARLSIAEPVVNRVRGGLLHTGLLPARKYAVIHPFAGWSFREWPIQAFAVLAERLVETDEMSVIFLWEGKKEGNLEWLRRHFNGHPSVLYASTLSLLATGVLISGASLFVGNDSGPLHLAAALGVPVVGLFGPSDPSLTAPRTQSQASWLYHHLDCSPCDQRKCVRPSDPCMKIISGAEAAEAAVSLWRRPADA